MCEIRMYFIVNGTLQLLWLGLGHEVVFLLDNFKSESSSIETCRMVSLAWKKIPETIAELL